MILQLAAFLSENLLEILPMSFSVRYMMSSYNNNIIIIIITNIKVSVPV